jgi:hypothetical protein
MKKYYVIYQPFGLGDGKQVSFYSKDENGFEVWTAGINEATFFESKESAKLVYDEYKKFLRVFLKELEFECNM